MKKIALSIVMLVLLLGTAVTGCPGNGGGGGNGGDNGSVPPSPAAFSVSNLSIQPEEVTAGETVTISVSVTNTGGSQGSYNVVLNINGTQQETEGVTIAAGSSQTVTFSVTRGGRWHICRNHRQSVGLIYGGAGNVGAGDSRGGNPSQC